MIRMSISKFARKQVAVLAIAGILSACGGSSSSGGMSPPPPPPPPGSPVIALDQVFSGVSFGGLIRLLQAPGDSTRWFAVEQRGVVWVFDNDASVASASVFIDISARVDSGPNEAGLLGMAFHPDWGTNGNFQVFLSYTRGPQLESVVSRFYSSDNGVTLDSSVEDIIMTMLQPFGNHNGGNIEFGPDGYLYAGWGDGGSGGDPMDNAQNLMNWLGSFTRVDVDNGVPYVIPPDNPFSASGACSQGVGADSCAEIYAWGVRNPWRWSFDSMTGDLWAGDVGQGYIDEVDVISPGGNFGWRCREGSSNYDTSGNCPAGLIDPITEYDHAVGQSITGGYVYRGTAIPELSGHYVFGDFVSGRIWAVAADSSPGTAADELMDTNLSISAFAVANDNELYVLDYGTGNIYQLTDGN
jgi:glucose/arabinose dehydrogenase